MDIVVLKEAVVVGIVFAVLLMLVSLVATPDTAVKQAACGFAAGALGHLFFEVAGLNKMYCDYKKQ